tara:strand:- start:613 stop:1605 length:993 start_codon:yes stop_codon:yes gene_type:complete
MKKLLLLSALFIVSFSSFSQEILDNQSVIDMIEFGFDEQVVINKIESTNSNFETSTEKLKSLKLLGATPNILSAMIRASKPKEESLKNDSTSLSDLAMQVPDYNETFFYWVNGKEELTKVKYFSSGIPVSKESIAGIITQLMIEAKFSLNNSLSFVPYKLFIFKREKSHKKLTKNDDTPYVAMLSYGGTNSYGAESEEFLTIGINPVLEEIDNPIKFQVSEDSSDKKQQKFTINKLYLNGDELNIKGSFTFTDDYWVLVIENTNTPTPIMPFDNKQFLGDNHWKEMSTQGEVAVALEYNGNETKYKSDGGALTAISMGYTMIYVLNKVYE